MHQPTIQSHQKKEEYATPQLEVQEPLRDITTMPLPMDGYGED